MLMLGLELVDRLPAVVRLGSVEVDARRIILEDPLRSLHAVDAAVGTGAGDVVLEQDDSPLGSADERAIEVAVDVLLIPLGCALWLLRLAPLGEAELLGAH